MIEFTDFKKVENLKKQAREILTPLPKNKMLPCLIYSKILDIVEEITRINRQMISTKFACLSAQETLEEIEKF